MSMKKKESETKWSREAEIFREKAIPLRMENNILTGMPRFVASRAIDADIMGAKEIAKRTDKIVDVRDLRVFSIAYIYNTKMALLGPTLEDACTEVYCVETGTGPLWKLENLPPRPREPYNALEGTGISSIKCKETLAWMRANAGAIDEALRIAAEAHGVRWNEERPIAHAFK